MFFKFFIYYLRRTSFFLLLRDPEENMSNDKRETISITNFYKMSFTNDFRIETEDGKMV